MISSSPKAIDSARFLVDLRTTAVVITAVGTITGWGSCPKEGDGRKEIPLDPFLALLSQFGRYHHRAAGLRAFLYRNLPRLAPSLVHMALRSSVELIASLLSVKTVALSANIVSVLRDPAFFAVFGPSPLYLMKRRVLVPSIRSLQHTTSCRSIFAAATRAFVILST